MRRHFGCECLNEWYRPQNLVRRFSEYTRMLARRENQNRSPESEVTTSRYSDECRREPSWHHDPPIPGLRLPGEDASPRTHTFGPLTPHIPSSQHRRGYPGAPCQSLERAGANRGRHPKPEHIGALRNMSGNAGAAAPRNGLAAGRTATSAENRRNIVERASGGGKGQGIIVDPR